MSAHIEEARAMEVGEVSFQLELEKFGTPGTMHLDDDDDFAWVSEDAGESEEGSLEEWDEAEGYGVDFPIVCAQRPQTL